MSIAIHPEGAEVEILRRLSDLESHSKILLGALFESTDMRKPIEETQKAYIRGEMGSWVDELQETCQVIEVRNVLLSYDSCL